MKQVVDFKVKVLDFIAIYVREMKKSSKHFDTLKLIKGLLKALQVAHSDKNTILFDRIKTVLTLIARGNVSQENGEESKAVSDETEETLKDKKILMTEVMSLVLKPTKDSKMHQAYIDCFISLTKHFSDSSNKQIVKYVVFTYKELLSKYLVGRGASAHSLN